MFLEKDELTKDMKDTLIEKAIVYAEGRIEWFGSSEIMWRS